MLINFKLISISLLLLLSISLNAQGPPIFTDSPLLLGLEGGGIRTFGKYIYKSYLFIFSEKGISNVILVKITENVPK